MAERIIAMIPARTNSTRFPGKLLKMLGNKSIICRTYEAVRDSKLFDEVYVVSATEDDNIRHEIENAGGKVIMSTKNHESGTDRIAEAVENIDCDIVVNIQGDEPFIEKQALEKVISLFGNEEVEIGSLMMPIFEKEKIQNPNCVKVVTDHQNRALYFSRSAIPYLREEHEEANYYQHIGVYAFRKETLLKITSLPQSVLEKTEKLENLRMLENGIDIYLAEVKQVGIAIDTPEDYEKAKAYLDSIS